MKMTPIADLKTHLSQRAKRPRLPLKIEKSVRWIESMEKSIQSHAAFT